MRKVRVKICGISRDEDLEVAVAAGADSVGFVVGIPSSPRNLSLKRAENLIKQVPIFVDSVVVTPLKYAVGVYDRLRPNAIQIPRENFFDVFAFHEKIPHVRLIKTVYVKTKEMVEEVIVISSAFDAVLLDSFTPDTHGGTGIVHDWKLSRRIRQMVEPKPLILAGGLTPKNVEDAICIVEPYAVDVSSGVESSPGIKDSQKVFDFIRKVKEVNL